MKQWIKLRFEVPIWAWLEAIVITGIVLLLSFYFNPKDPFFIRATFPWTWLAPALIALRYGLGPGLFSVLIIVVTYMLSETSVALYASFHRVYLLGGFILTMICGEYYSFWVSRVRYAEEYSDYAKECLANLSKAYYVASLSHDRLETNLINKPVTLRGALNELRHLLVDYEGNITPEIAKRYLNLLAYHCSITQGGLYLVTDGDINIEPIAFIGKKRTLHVNDVLVKYCIDEEMTSYHAVNELDPQKTSDYLVVSPVFASDGTFYGLVAVENMPFLSLNYETLQVLTVLQGYFADGVWASSHAATLLQQYTDCPHEFAQEIYKLTRIKREVDIDSAIVAFYVKPHKMRERFIESFKTQQRGLDYIWQHEKDDDIILLVLIPFAGDSVIVGYLERIANWLVSEFAVKLGDDLVNYEVAKLPESEPEKVIDQFMESIPKPADIIGQNVEATNVS